MNHIGCALKTIHKTTILTSNQRKFVVMKSKKIIVIGGGAAGFFGAISAAERFPDFETVILEKNRTVLNKVRVSGGGRCNVTNALTDPRKFAAQYPRGETFLKNLFKQFSAADTIGWFEQRGVVLKTESDGRMFPQTDSSETIIDCLTRAARAAKIDIRTSAGVKYYWFEDQKWHVSLLDDTVLEADRLLVATGGNPQLLGYENLTNLDEHIEPPVPSLFTFNTPTNFLRDLAGVSVQDAEVKIIGSKPVSSGLAQRGLTQRGLAQRGPVLITHWGFSGPAILRLSAWGARLLSESNYDFTLKINWLAGQTDEQVRVAFIKFKQENPRKQVASNPLSGIPSRLWLAFCAESTISGELRWVDISNKSLNQLVEFLTNSQFKVSGKTTFKEEFVTCGGVSLSTINPQTMESTMNKGLFFAGEVIDIDGITGGFNFQSAWSSGYVAGKNIGV